MFAARELRTCSFVVWRAEPLRRRCLSLSALQPGRSSVNGFDWNVVILSWSPLERDRLCEQRLRQLANENHSGQVIICPDWPRNFQAI